MTPDLPGYNYTALLHGALLGVVREVLGRAAQEGLPGDHHFFLTFGTREPGVEMSPRLRKAHPEEMTIVLQHQYWNLSVGDEGFAVTLRFGGSPERLVVPWPALRSFADPSVSFGLRLTSVSPADEAEAAAPASEAAPPPKANAKAPARPGPKVVDFGAYRRRDGDAE